MRNRAKCCLCGDVLESFHAFDHVTCKCGEISIDSGTTSFKCSARDWKNFLRIDDEDREIVPTIVDKAAEDAPIAAQVSMEPPPLTRAELIASLTAMIDNYENLPDHAKLQAVNHYDVISILLIMRELFK